MVLAPALLGDKCWPLVSMAPAFAAGTALADDSLVGSYVVAANESALYWEDPAVPVTIARADTVDGASYLLEYAKGRPDAATLRLFRFDVAGGRYADVVVEDSREVDLARTFAASTHLAMRVGRPAPGGVALDFLHVEWFNKLPAPKPRAIDVTQRYRTDGTGAMEADRMTVLLGDTAEVQALLSRAAAEPDAWGAALELVRDGAPMFKVTSDRWGRGPSQGEVWTVIGVRITHRRYLEDRGPRIAVAKAPAKLHALLAALLATSEGPATKPPDGVPLTTVCVQVPNVRRCTLEHQGSGPEHDALLALRAAVRAAIS